MRVVAVQFLVGLRTRKLCLTSVYDHTLVAHVHEWRPFLIGLSGKDPCDFRSKPSDRFARGINHKPLSTGGQIFSAWKISTHICLH
jgi:hypothetical protein